MWRYDYTIGDIIFFEVSTQNIVDGEVVFGDEINSDLEISLGDRDNDTSIVDQGLRVIEGLS
jgi:hypothetical protein